MILTFVGRLGRDVELRSTRDGTAVANLRVAVKRRGPKQRDDLWLDVTVWRGLAENCARFLSTGREVYVVADDVDVREFQRRDGTPGFALEVTARDVQFIGGRPDGGDAGGFTPRSDVPVDDRDFAPAVQAQAATPAAGDDDIPF